MGIHYNLECKSNENVLEIKMGKLESKTVLIILFNNKKIWSNYQVFSDNIFQIWLPINIKKQSNHMDIDD